MIRSNEIQETVAHGELLTDIGPPTRSLQMGALSLPVSETVIGLTDEHARQIEGLISQGLAEFPHENTLVQSAIGRPTALARLDCTISSGGIVPYECEDRPAGLGVDHLLNQMHTGTGSIEQIQRHIVETLGSEMVIVRHKEAAPNDDAAALDVFDDISDINGRVIMVRGEPHMFDDERNYSALAERSLSTIKTEGDKNYSLRLSSFGGRLIQSAGDLPDRDESFVLKTLQGSKSRGVNVYLSKFDQKQFGSKGIVTYTKMQRIAQAQAPMIAEQLKQPIRVEGMGNMILRILILVNADSVRAVGGAFAIRPEMLVHGATNAIAGLVMMEDRT